MTLRAALIRLTHALTHLWCIGVAKPSSSIQALDRARHELWMAYLAVDAAMEREQLAKREE